MSAEDAIVIRPRRSNGKLEFQVAWVQLHNLEEDSEYKDATILETSEEAVAKAREMMDNLYKIYGFGPEYGMVML